MTQDERLIELEAYVKPARVSQVGINTEYVFGVFSFRDSGEEQMIFEWMSDPAAWVGLLALIVLLS